MAVALLRHVQVLEADESFSGVLSSTAAAAGVDATPREVKIELKRLLDDGYLVASDQAEDLDGVLDLAEPRLTTQGVAAVAARL